MDIKLPFDSSQPSATSKSAMLPFDLKLNQLLDAKVVDSQSTNNSTVLLVAGKTMQVETTQLSAAWPAGQALQLQVVKLLPTPEFKVFSSASPQTGHPAPAQVFAAPTLKLLNPQSLTNADPLPSNLHDQELGPPPQAPMPLSSAIDFLDAEAEQRLIKLLGLLLQRIQDPTAAAQPTLTNDTAMDIKLPLDVNLQTAATKASNNPLNLKLDQILAAKVVDTQIMLNTLALSVADKRILVQTQQALNLQPGQSLQLQVVKLLPVPEFKIVNPASPQAANQTSGQTSDTLTLKLLSVQPSISADTFAKLSLSQLTAGQQLQATIVDIAGNKLTLQLLPAQVSADGNRSIQTASTPNPANLLVTLDSKHLIFAATENQAAPAALKTPASALPALAPGTQLNLQVLKTGDSPTFAVSLPVTSTEQKIVELFKQLLPIQTSSAPLLNHLNQILPALENDATIAETLKRLAQEILDSIPLKTQLTVPAQLKQSVDQSGLFLESKLAQLLSGTDGASLQDDLKLKLVKFVQLLTAEIEAQAQQKSALDSAAILKEALQKAHAALAKLTLDQFQSIPRDESAKLAWVLELPFFHNQKADTVQIEIERDKQGSQDTEQKNWAVSITITPPELATIHCRISCYDGAVNTRFWSDAADTVDKINAHLDYLKQQFEQKGLKTGFMEAHQGKPAQTDSVKKPLTNLLSEKV